MRVIDDASKYETWQSAVKGKIFVRRFDRKGDLVSEMVGPSRTLHITPEERRLNSERAASEAQDVFSNGMLVPVALIDGGEDVEAIRDNPNHMTETAIRELFVNRRAYKQFDEAVESISNPITLSRMLEIARDEDATLRQVDKIQNRLSEVSGAPTTTEVEVISAPSGRDVLRTKAPESPRAF